MQGSTLYQYDYSVDAADGYQGSGVHLRRLNQPFAWNDEDQSSEDGESGGAQGGKDQEAGEGERNGTRSGGGGQQQQHSTCRNSVQGKMLIADDRGEFYLPINQLSFPSTST